MDAALVATAKDVSEQFNAYTGSPPPPPQVVELRLVPESVPWKLEGAERCGEANIFEVKHGVWWAECNAT